MVITALTRNQMVGVSRHVGSNPTLSASENAPAVGFFIADTCDVDESEDSAAHVPLCWTPEVLKMPAGKSTNAGCERREIDCQVIGWRGTIEQLIR